MNILYVVNDFFPRFYGGVERYVLNVGKQMQRMGHGVKVLTYGMEDTCNGYTRRGDIFVKYYSYETVPVISVRHPEIPGDIGYRVGDEVMEKHLKDLISREEIDVVHIGHPMKFSSMVNVARQLGIPSVLTLTDFWLLCPRGRFYKPDYSPCNSPESGRKCADECGFGESVVDRYRMAEKVFRTVDCLVAPSRFIMKVFEMNNWRREITLVRHGVDYQYVEADQTRTRSDGDSIVFGYTGLITRFKGVDLLVDSFRRVKSDRICLQIYGDVYKDWILERGFFEQLRKTVQKDRRIQMMGKYSHSELPSILNRLDVNIVPSTTLESYGLVVTESLSYRVPVIASDVVGSAHEFIRDGVDGFVFPVNRPERLTEIIEHITREPSLIGEMRRNIAFPPRIEEEAFMLEAVYREFSG